MLLGPVEVLHEQHDRTLRGELGEKVRPRVLEAVAHEQRVLPGRDVDPEREREEPTLAEELEHTLGAVALEDAEVLLQHLGQRPVRDPLAVGQAAAGAAERLRRVVREPIPELAHEAGLADARVADDRNQPRPPVLGHPAQRREEPFELPVAADEHTLQAAHSSRAHQRERAQERPAPHAGRLALRLDRPLVAELEGSARSRHRPLADQDLARLGTLLEPRRDVHRIARDERASLSWPPDDDLARVDADAKLEPGVDRANALPQREGGVQAPLGVVLEGQRCSEGGHHGITVDGRRARGTEARSGRKLGSAAGTDLHARILAQLPFAVTSLTSTDEFGPRFVIQTT